MSRIQVGRAGPFRVPRFNMPFELGLAAAVALARPATHQWRLLETVQFRIGQSLSDVAGYDAHIHCGTVAGVVDVLLDIFAALPDPPLGEANDLLWVYRKLSRYRETLPANIYRPNSFKKLVLAARGFANQRKEFFAAPV
jgi:hypothetical protein